MWHHEVRIRRYFLQGLATKNCLRVSHLHVAAMNARDLWLLISLTYRCHDVRLASDMHALLAVFTATARKGLWGYKNP